LLLRGALIQIKDSTAPIPMADVRFGSKADILAVSHHVRFTPKSEHC
jgi:hypothetical protein